MIQFELLHPNMTKEHLGIIPYFLSEDNPAPAKDQIAAKYIGGWSRFDGFQVINRDTMTIQYPNDPGDDDPADPPLKPLASASLRDEKLYFYDGAWLLILQPNGDYEIARLD